MRYQRIFTMLLLTIMLFVSIAAYAEPFSFRNGITFGMDEETVRKTEEANGQILSDQWYEGSISAGYILQSGVHVRVSSYDATLFYFFSEGKVEAAWYDLYKGENETMYEAISEAVSAVYGAEEPINAMKIVKLMDYFQPGVLSASDVTRGKVWQTENAVIYQFCYNTGHFMVIYTDPGFEYANVDTTGI